MLSGERQELRPRCATSAWRWARSRRFVRENREVLGRNISGLNRVSKVLVKQRGALDEVLNDAPVALNNLALTYNPQAGTLDTRANQGAARRPDRAPTRRRSCARIVEPGRHLGQRLRRDQAGARRGAGDLRPGGRASAPQDRFDQTLGGLVEAPR